LARDFFDSITKFLGLRESEAGEGRFTKGESPRMKNLKITPHYTLMKRKGYTTLFKESSQGRGIWCGNLKNSNRLIWVVGNEVRELKGDYYKVLGKLESSKGNVTLFKFDTKLYFLDGVKIKFYDGETFGNITPYIPLVAISCDYLGAGVGFEDVNLLTGTKRQSFTMDGVHSYVKLLEKEIDSVDSVKYQGKELSKSFYEVNLLNGSVSFDEDAVKDTSPDAVEITYTKNAEGMAECIHRMKYAVLYGGDNDTRIFLWGDGEYPLHVRYSGVCGGETSMDYFPELNFNKIPSATQVTSLVRHYDRLMIFCEGETYFSYGENKSDANGKEYTVFPVKTLSSEIGCKAKNFAKLIDNTPVTVMTGSLYKWSSSAIRDERNAREFGERIRVGLKKMNMNNIRSFDRTGTKELYLWQGEDIYVYNYALDVFYYYTGFSPYDFAEDDGGRLYFVSRDGSLCTESDKGYDGESEIEFLWEGNYEDFHGLDTKNIHTLEFEIFPVSATSFDISFVSERQSSRHEKIESFYKLFDFENFDFSKMSFLTAVTPVRLHKRIKAKRLRGFKLVIKNLNSTPDFHLLKIGVEGRVTYVR